jgi:hypothetical protein
MENKKRFTLSDVVKNTFYQMPKFLFGGEFKKLNNDARVLYSILKDRHELSMMNGWINENDEVYIIFSREEMQDILGLSDKPVTNAIKKLKELNLIEEDRIGLGQANKIYLLIPETVVNPDNSQTRKFYGSERGKSPNKQSANRHIPSIINKTYFSETESKSSQTDENFDADNDNEIIQKVQKEQKASDNKKGLSKPHASPAMDKESKPPESNKTLAYDYNTTKKKLQENIAYFETIKFNKKYNPGHNIDGDLKLMDELINCMLDVICTDTPKVKINGELKPREMVIKQYFSINAGDIQHIIAKFKEQRDKITHVNSYLKTLLYTVKQEGNFQVENAVREKAFFPRL